jgi:hypothetical protein
MIWTAFMYSLVSTASAGPPGLVLTSGPSSKALKKVQDTVHMPTMETVDAGELGIDAYLAKLGDLCSLDVDDDTKSKLTELAADRPELWVARNGSLGVGMWKWDGQALQRHPESEGHEPQPADVLVLQVNGETPTLKAKKIGKALGHEDLKLVESTDTSGIAATLLKSKLECIPAISKEELTTIDGYATEGRALYVVVVEDGDPLYWRWDIDTNGLKHL